MSSNLVRFLAACVWVEACAAAEPAQAGQSPDAAGVRRIAVFADAEAPKLTAGCADPARLAELLRTPQRQITLLDTAQLADPKQLSPALFDLLVLPYGPSLPDAATESVRAFLKGGGDFVSVGGYAFDHLYGKNVSPDLELLTAPGMEEPGALEHWTSDQAIAQAADMSTVGRAIVQDGPHGGVSCLRFQVPDALPKAWYNINQQVTGLAPGQSYAATCWIRTERVHDGFAYLAVSFHDAAGKRLSFVQDARQDTCGTLGWRRAQCRFTVPPNTAFVRVVGNLYGYGTAYFDDFSLKWFDGGGFNTHFGKVGDQLHFREDQVGVFDASYRLERAVACETSPDQRIVTADGALQGPLQGFAAVGMTSANDAVGPVPRARWTSLVQARDGYGRLAGSVLGVTHNFKGTFKHSLWAYAGLENTNLFDGSHPAYDQALQQVVEHLLTGVFLHSPEPEFMLYRPGERIVSHVNLCNAGRDSLDLRVVSELVAGGKNLTVQDVTRCLAAGQDEPLVFEMVCPDGLNDLVCELRYRLFLGEREVDTVRTGFFVPNGKETEGFPLSFRDSYFRAGGRPMMLFGVNQTGVMFGPDYENPLTWMKDYGRCRDFGFNVWRVLHVSAFADPAGYRFGTLKIDTPPERLLRRMDAVFELAQHFKIVPMPCWYDTRGGATVSDSDLELQAGFARRYGERYRKLSGMLYDVSNEITIDYADQPDLHRDFRAFLTTKYGNDEALCAAWGDPTASLAAAKYENPPADWASRKGHDIEVFRLYVMERWLAPSINAVRETGDTHPVTTENYVWKLPAGDPFESRRLLTFANMHHYGDWQPGYARFFERRMQGRGHVVGEFGRTSHPGQVSFGNYCPEPEALVYFRRATFLNAGLGAAGMFVWDMKDMRGSGFPYGVHYHSELVPKKVGFLFRNLAFFFRRFAPEFKAEDLWFVVPDQFLLGGGQNDFQTRLYSALTALTKTNVQFSLIRQYELARVLKEKPKAIVFPLAYILGDDDVGTLLEYAKKGGFVYLSGDCAFTPDREETRRDVLSRLCGVEPSSRRFADVRFSAIPPVPSTAVGALPAFDAYPTYELNAVSATVLRQAGNVPLVCENRIGKGAVWFINDPLELHLTEAELIPIYADVAARAGVKPLLETSPDSGLIALGARTEKHGELTVVLNDGTTDQKVTLGNVELACPAGAQVAVFRAKSGKIVALALAGAASIDGTPFQAGTGHLLLTALDGKDLRKSEAILALPLSQGQMDLVGVDGTLTAEVGEVTDGHWTCLERVAQVRDFAVDDLRATGMFLLTRPGAAGKWAEAIEQMTLAPEKMDEL